MRKQQATPVAPGRVVVRECRQVGEFAQQPMCGSFGNTCGIDNRAERQPSSGRSYRLENPDSFR